MGNTPDPSKQPVAQPGDPIDLTESVAGEEDPGAAVDLADTPARPAGGVKPTPSPDKDRPSGGS